MKGTRLVPCRIDVDEKWDHNYVGYMWVVHCEDVGIMLILSPETSHILSVLPLHNSTLISDYFIASLN